MSRAITFTAAINEAMHQAMEKDANVITYGLGVDDPKSIFGTTEGLKQRFGAERVFDTPTSENAMTGIGIGAALLGTRPIMVHQRLDFFLLAMDQLVNSAAKWHFMFGGNASVPITIRLILGRGWGQGPTHSQNLQAWFAHIPGLKIVNASNPKDAKGLLLESIFDNNPVIFLEHRWLHNSEGEVPKEYYTLPLGVANIMREGSAVTITSMSYMTAEAMIAADVLREAGVSCEVIDLRSLSPIDWETIYHSVRKTGRLIALDTGAEMCSISAEIIARVSSICWASLKHAPLRIAMPNFPEPTSFSLTKDFYPTANDIIKSAFDMMGFEEAAADALLMKPRVPHDVPGEWFKGPF